MDSDFFIPCFEDQCMALKDTYGGCHIYTDNAKCRIMSVTPPLRAASTKKATIDWLEQQGAELDSFVCDCERVCVTLLCDCGCVVNVLVGCVSDSVTPTVVRGQRPRCPSRPRDATIAIRTRFLSAPLNLVAIAAATWRICFNEGIRKAVSWESRILQGHGR